LTWTNFF